jgi:acyl-phosphate glycerol 3-phosphate acyltransferase
MTQPIWVNLILPIILVVGGYLLGGILPAEWYFKRFKKHSAVELGEKPGTFAVLRHIGLFPAILCLLYDIGKGFIPAFLALKLNVNLYWLPAISLAPVVGHNWPFLRWKKGGWGLAAATGALLALGCWLSFIGLAGIPFAFIFKKKRGVGIGLVAFPLILIMLIVFHKPWEVVLSAILVMALTIFRRLTGEKKQKAVPAE